MRTSLRNSLSWNKKLSITKFRNSTKIMRVVDSSRPSRLHGSIECHHLVYHTSSPRDKMTVVNEACITVIKSDNTRTNPVETVFSKL